MGDVYATITEADHAVQAQLAEVLELRGRRSPAARDARRLRGRASARRRRARARDRVRHGAVARAIAARPGLGAVVGIDPSEVFVQRARTL
jgi:hypothetical protein